MKTVYDAFNGSKFMLMTEACSGYSLGTSWVGPRHGEWGYGYTTSHDILWQLRNRASGWVYWNLMLDEIGGPNLAGNYVDSPSYRINSTSFALNPSYFHMAHFSRYVVPGSVAVRVFVFVFLFLVSLLTENICRYKRMFSVEHADRSIVNS